ncbi:MAG: hypothetical protein ACQEQF_09095 [Bacillota bacterium]
MREKKDNNLIWLMIALSYFAAASESLVTVALIVGIGLYFEEDETLTFHAVQAFLAVVVFLVLKDMIYILNIPYDIDRWFISFVNIARLIILIPTGLNVKNNKDKNLPYIGDWLKKQINFKEIINNTGGVNHEN